MSIEEERAKYEKLRNDCIWYRGKIIDETIFMELLMDDIIAYFLGNGFGEKVSQIISLVLSTEHVTLGGKEQILQSILINHFPNYWKGNTDLIQNISKFRKNRNHLAHSKLIATTQNVFQYDGNKLPIVIFKNGKGESLGAEMNNLENEVKGIYDFNQRLKELQKMVRKSFPSVEKEGTI